MLRVVGVGERIRETELRYLAGTTLELAFDGLGAVFNIAATVQAADLTGLLGDVA